MKAVEILERVISRAIWGGRRRKVGRPGEMIEGLDSDSRAAIKGLKSDDISEERIGNWVGWLGFEESWSNKLRQMKLEFDKKIGR